MTLYYPILRLIALLQQNNDETATTTQNLHVQMTSKAGDMSLPIKKHVLLNSFVHKLVSLVDSLIFSPPCPFEMNFIGSTHTTVAITLRQIVPSMNKAHISNWF